MSSLYQAKMKQRGVAVVPETKAGRELDKELADMRKRKATVEDRPCSSVRSVQFEPVAGKWVAQARVELHMFITWC